jgi:galactose mutarotase-like enzyme
VIILRSDELLVRIDPAHGGEILDLLDLNTGRQLLGRPPFGSELALPGDLDETTWTASYRGGWQTVLPNAGNACEVGGDQHGFHGSASIDPWEASETTETGTLLRWSGHGLEVEKRIELEGGALTVRYRIANATDKPVPLVALEHLSVGLEILHPTVRLAFPAAKAYELSESEGPLEPPEHATGWPQIALLDGSTERGDRQALETPRSRLYVMNGLAEGWAAVWSATRGQGLALAWDVKWFAHAWVWHENRISPDPWRQQGEIMAIEPSTVPHSLGLAVAEEAGQARVLEPGEIAEPWIVARPFVATGDVRGVGHDGAVSY